MPLADRRQARPLVAHRDDKHLPGRPFAGCRPGGVRLHGEFDPSSFGVIEGVAGDLRNRRGDAGLLRRVETECRGQLPGALPTEHHVVLQTNLQREQA